MAKKRLQKKRSSSTIRKQESEILQVTTSKTEPAPSIGGIFMKYSYEYKKKCVELYRQGKWPETPEGVNEKRFHDTWPNYPPPSHRK